MPKEPPQMWSPGTIGGKWKNEPISSCSKRLEISMSSRCADYSKRIPFSRTCLPMWIPKMKEIKPLCTALFSLETSPSANSCLINMLKSMLQTKMERRHCTLHACWVTWPWFDFYFHDLNALPHFRITRATRLCISRVTHSTTQSFVFLKNQTVSSFQQWTSTIVQLVTCLTKKLSRLANSQDSLSLSMLWTLLKTLEIKRQASPMVISRKTWICWKYMMQMKTKRPRPWKKDVSVWTHLKWLNHWERAVLAASTWSVKKAKSQGNFTRWRSSRKTRSCLKIWSGMPALSETSSRLPTTSSSLDSTLHSRVRADCIWLWTMHRAVTWGWHLPTTVASQWTLLESTRLRLFLHWSTFTSRTLSLET